MDDFEEKEGARGARKGGMRSFADMRRDRPRAFMRWSEEEDSQLSSAYRMHVAGKSDHWPSDEFVKEMANKFERHSGAIYARLGKLQFLPEIAERRREADERRHKGSAGEAIAQEEKKKGRERWENIDMSADFKKAFDVMEDSSKHVFITGRAGTGKSTLLSYFRDHTEKKIVVLAPTGVAAVNVKGQTIHSFFGFKPDITRSKVKKIAPWHKKAKLYRALQAIVIDEISMARADIVDCIDKFLRLNGPDDGQEFGGVQLIFFGDLYQLPPVVTREEREAYSVAYRSPYFFDAEAFEGLAFELIELAKVYRQKDEDFIRLLNAIRDNRAGDTELSKINARVGVLGNTHSEFVIRLTTTNADAARENEAKLKALPGALAVFHGTISGKFNEKIVPADLELSLKTGAQVMLLNNDQKGRWVNGTVGEVVGLPLPPEDNFGRDESQSAVIVRLETGIEVRVEKNVWDMFEYIYNEGAGDIDVRVAGSFIQYPLRLAWAVTIHKSQGKTFNRVVVDLGAGTFAHGQLYVALSRCRTLEGISLIRPVERRHLILDERVVRFMKDPSARRSALGI